MEVGGGLGAAPPTILKIKGARDAGFPFKKYICIFFFFFIKQRNTKLLVWS